MKQLSWTVAMVLACPALTIGQGLGLDPEYVRDGADLYVVEGARRFPVSDVVSVRFRAGVSGLEAYRASAPGVSAVVRDLRELRANRLGVHDLRVPAGADVLAVVAELRASGLVEMAETNTFGEYVTIPNDALFSAQWHLRNTGQTGGTPDADVDAELADDARGVGGDRPHAVRPAQATARERVGERGERFPER